MKKTTILLAFMLAGCADTAMLGYPGVRYDTIPESNVQVYYNASVPSGCSQVALSIVPIKRSLSDAIDFAREEASKAGGNYVNITSLSYTVNAFGSGNKNFISVIYRCNK